MPRLVMVLALSLVLESGQLLLPVLGLDSDSQCEAITASLCNNADLGYNLTRMPNSLGHQSQDEAALEVHQFFPLVKVRCSESLQRFLCLLYVPECVDGTDGSQAPCRELCQDARHGCESLMNKFGYKWPSNLACDSLPSAAAGEPCVGDPRAPPEETPTSPPTDQPPSTVQPGSPAQPEAAAEPTDAACRCDDRGDSEDAADAADAAETARRHALELLTKARRLFQLAERTLRMKRRNMQLEQQKLQLEIQLLQRQLDRN